MAKPLAEDFRDHVLSSENDGLTNRELAKRYGISASAVGKWRQAYRESGKTKADKIGGSKKCTLEPYRDWIKKRITEGAHVTIAKIQAELAELGVKVSMTTVWNFITKKLNFSFKKKTKRAKEVDEEKLAADRKSVV